MAPPVQMCSNCRLNWLLFNLSVGYAAINSSTRRGAAVHILLARRICAGPHPETERSRRLPYFKPEGGPSRMSSASRGWLPGFNKLLWKGYNNRRCVLWRTKLINLPWGGWWRHSFVVAVAHSRSYVCYEIAYSANKNNNIILELWLGKRDKTLNK